MRSPAFATATMGLVARRCASIDLDPDREMVGTEGGKINPGFAKAVGKACIDEAVIEMGAFGPPGASGTRGDCPAIASGRQSSEASQRVDGFIQAQDTAVAGVRQPGHGKIFRRFRLHVEVAQNEEVVGERWVGGDKAVVQPAGHSPALLAKIQEPFLDEADLADALIAGDMIEMNRIDAQWPGRRGNQGLKGATLQIQFVEGATARQEKVARRQDRPARQDHVAELQAPLHSATVFGRCVNEDVAWCAKGMEMVGKEIRKRRDEIGMAVLVKTAGHFLQRDDIGPGHALRNAFGVKTAIHADPVLDVIAYELHDNL